MTTTTQTKIDSVFTCPRCDGKGWLPEFRHIKNGDCFLCGGAKVITSNRKFKADKFSCSYSKIRLEKRLSARGWVAYQKECAKAMPHWQNLKVEEYQPGFYNVSYEFERMDVEGKNMDMSLFITDSNRQEMSNFWTWLKGNGCKMTVEK